MLLSKISLVILVGLAMTQASPVAKKSTKTAVAEETKLEKKELAVIPEAEEGKEIDRSKKSAIGSAGTTTTFCVEIKPSSGQVPLTLCDQGNPNLPPKPQFPPPEFPQEPPPPGFPQPPPPPGFPQPPPPPGFPQPPPPPGFPQPPPPPGFPQPPPPPGFPQPPPPPGFPQPPPPPGFPQPPPPPGFPQPPPPPGYPEQPGFYQPPPPPGQPPNGIDFPPQQPSNPTGPPQPFPPIPVGPSLPPSVVLPPNPVAVYIPKPCPGSNPYPPPPPAHEHPPPLPPWCKHCQASLRSDDAYNYHQARSNDNYMMDFNQHPNHQTRSGLFFVDPATGAMVHDGRQEFSMMPNTFRTFSQQPQTTDYLNPYSFENPSGYYGRLLGTGTTTSTATTTSTGTGPGLPPNSPFLIQCNPSFIPLSGSNSYGRSSEPQHRNMYQLSAEQQQQQYYRQYQGSQFGRSSNAGQQQPSDYQQFYNPYNNPERSAYPNQNQQQVQQQFAPQYGYDHNVKASEQPQGPQQEFQAQPQNLQRYQQDQQFQRSQQQQQGFQNPSPIQPNSNQQSSGSHMQPQDSVPFQREGQIQFPEEHHVGTLQFPANAVNTPSQMLNQMRENTDTAAASSSKTPESQHIDSRVHQGAQNMRGSNPQKFEMNPPQVAPVQPYIINGGRNGNVNHAPENHPNQEVHKRETKDGIAAKAESTSLKKSES